jgi:hypothetical protein
MKDLFVSYEQALQVKELGFNEPCLFGYNQDDENKLMTVPQLSSYEINSAKNSDVTKINKVTVPLKQQVLRWFREKYELHGYIEGMYPWCRYYINSEDDRWEGHKYNTYEECENSLTNKLIEIVKNKP